MSPSLKGVVLGIVALAALDAVVSRPSAAAATGGAWVFANNALNKFISPAYGFFGTAAKSPTPAKSTTAQTTTATPAPTDAASLLFSST